MVGQRPEEPYYIEKRLAAGGMAEVFVAKRIGPHGFEKRVALKRILPQFAADADFVHMFIDEARLAARLDHPNIVQVFDFGQSDRSFFIAMELVDGSNVNLLLRAVAARDEAVPIEVAVHIVIEAARALAYAHSLRDDQDQPLNLVHRDVSPANLLLTRDGHMKLSDFGIARAANYEARTQTGQLRGKLGYMSPEQVLGRDLDGRSDIFTLMTIFAEMLIAEPLFGKGTDLDVLMRIRDVDLTILDRSKRRVSPDVRALIARGLARDPADRPSASALLELLTDFAQRRSLASGGLALGSLLLRLGLVEPRAGETPPREVRKQPQVAPLPRREAEAITAEALSEELITYRARTEAGQYAGLTYAQIVELILAGRADSDTMLSASGSEFERAGNFGELKRFVQSPALQWRERDFARPTLQGQLARASLLPIVHRLAVGQETGVLYLASEHKRKKIYFVEGRPDFISSTDPTELLGALLVRKGMCLRMEVDMALAVLPRYHGRLCDALVGLSILRPIDLVRAIQTQARERFLEGFTWRSGEWRYVRGARSQEELLGGHADTFEWLRDAALAADAGELEAALDSVRERVLTRNAEPVVPVNVYRVPAFWRALLESVNGRSTLSSIVARESSRGADPSEVYRALYLGLSCDLLKAA